MDPGFKLKQIGVTMLGVKDAQRSIAFYRHKLGRAVKSAFEGFVFLDGGVRTISTATSGTTLGLLANRADGQPIPDF